MNLNAKKISLSFLALAAFWSTCAGASIFVVHANRSPATGCVKVGSAGILAYSGDGAVANDSSTESLTVECPVVSFPSSGTRSQLLWYRDDSASTLSCIYRSESPTSSDFTSTSVSSTADGPGRRSFSVTATTLSGGYNHYRCVIPPRDGGGSRSGVYGYEGW